MDSKQMGMLIAELRKEKSMTQKELADKLNVTDKAISKWERGNGYPEITIIPMLAKVLDVTASELLAGQRNTIENIKINEAEEIVSDTIVYIEKTSKYKAANIAASIISAIFLLGLFVCFLCNYVIDKKFSWSLYPAGALIVTWLTIIPLLLFNKHRALWSLFGMTISVLPYLFLVERLSPAKGWVIPLALPIVLVSIVSLLVIIYLFIYKKINTLYVLAITTFLFGVIVNIAVKSIVDSFLGIQHDDISAVITALSCAFVSVLLVIYGYLKKIKIQR